ncbi:6446_t:CDS:2 [Rhizophagus irregularis]|nr:6446_t:CDS:2 [Rhizophagus irregularis]
MDKENDKDIVVNEINILNSEVSDNLINEDFDLEIYKQHELGEQDYEDSINPKTKNPLKINEKYGLPVVLKSLNDSSNINDNFLNEWKLHLQCQYRAALYADCIITEEEAAAQEFSDYEEN